MTDTVGATRYLIKIYMTRQLNEYWELTPASQLAPDGHRGEGLELANEIAARPLKSAYH